MADPKRLKALVHYVCDKCTDPTKLGATKLNKALWYSDTFAYRLLGKTISGESTYVKRQFGPVPKRILQTLRELSDDGLLKIRETAYFGKPKREFISLKNADVSAFTNKEREIIDFVIETICNAHTAASVSDLSHDLIWEAAELGEDIPVYAVLAANAAPVTKKDKLWADKIIKDRMAVRRRGARVASG